MQAESSPTGGFGVVIQDTQHRLDPSSIDTAYVGNSFTGLGSQMNGVRAIEYDSTGTLLQATDTTIPDLVPFFSDEKIFDIASSKFISFAKATPLLLKASE